MWYGLLIEPIWNRNVLPLSPATVSPILLIEPIWNRNIPTDDDLTGIIRTFNRTNLE